MRKCCDKSIKVIVYHSQAIVQHHSTQLCANVGMLNQKIDLHLALYNIVLKTNIQAKILNSAISMHLVFCSSLFTLNQISVFSFFSPVLCSSSVRDIISIFIRYSMMYYGALHGALSSEHLRQFLRLLLFHLYSSSSYDYYYYYDYLVYSSPRIVNNCCLKIIMSHFSLYLRSCPM